MATLCKVLLLLTFLSSPSPLPVPHNTLLVLAGVADVLDDISDPHISVVDGFESASRDNAGAEAEAFQAIDRHVEAACRLLMEVRGRVSDSDAARQFASLQSICRGSGAAAYIEADADTLPEIGRTGDDGTDREERTSSLSSAEVSSPPTSSLSSSSSLAAAAAAASDNSENEASPLRFLQAASAESDNSSVDDGEPKTIQEKVEEDADYVRHGLFHWFFYVDQFGFPWLQNIASYIVLLLVVILFETYFLQSTLFTRKKKQFYQSLKSADKAFRKAAAAGFRFRYQAPGQPQEKESLESQDDTDVPRQWREPEVLSFWQSLEEFLRTDFSLKCVEVLQQTQQDYDEIQFTARTFAAYASAGEAIIYVQRDGPCRDTDAVRVRTLERGFQGYKAIAGEDFEHVETTLTFEPGVRLMSFSVPLIRHGTLWAPTQWFAVELMEVVAGDAVLGESLVVRWGDQQQRDSRFARVYILAEHTFPHDIPKERVDSPFWIITYYIRERIKRRGVAFWKTLVALCYEPVHNVMVCTILQKEMVNWACSWNDYGTGCYWRITLLVGLQFVSTALQSWADRVQTRFRARTGQTRQYHRWQLLATMLMIDHEDLAKSQSSRWFYTAMQNCDSLTNDGYWHTFLLARDCFALFIAVVTALVFLEGGSKIAKHVVVAVVCMVFILPVSLLWISRRRQRIWEMLQERMQAEETWMHTLTWTAGSVDGLYSWGPRERAWLEQRWTQENKLFIKKHQASRDLINDSVWVNRWFASLAYIVLFLNGAEFLLAEQISGSEGWKSANYLLLMKISWDFQRYMSKMVDSITLMQKAGIALLKVKHLLDISVATNGEEDHAREIAFSHNEPQSSDFIEFHGVEYTPPSGHQGLAAMGSLRMSPDCVVQLPLRRMVRVYGSSDRTRTTFLALVAQVVRPVRGSVRIPAAAWASMLPAVPIGCPNLTICEALSIAGMPSNLASRLAKVLGLEESEPARLLSPGQLQALTIARNFMRDPAVLVLVKPFALMERLLRRRMQHLLRVWQLGGAKLIADWLLDKPPNVAPRRATMRSVFITSEDLDDDETGEIPKTDLFQDLTEFLVRLHWTARSASSIHVDEDSAEAGTSEEVDTDTSDESGGTTSTDADTSLFRA